MLTSAIATITLNRPAQKNALDLETIKNLINNLDNLENNKNIKILKIQAAGNYFCAGLDLKWISSNLNNLDNLDLNILAELFFKLINFSKPIISLVQGGATGGGIGLLAASDLVIADQNAKFCFAETKLGLIPAVISPLIYQIMGIKKTHQYFITAEIFNAEQALKFGLVDDLVDLENLNTQSELYINKILQNDFLAIQACKKLKLKLTKQMGFEINQELLNNLALELKLLLKKPEIQARLKNWRVI